MGGVVNVARLNAALAPLGAKSMRALNIANKMLDNITKKLNKVEPAVSNIGEPLLEAQQKGNKLINNITSQTKQLDNLKKV